MGSGVNIEPLRIPVIAVATNDGLTFWEEEEEFLSWRGWWGGGMDGWRKRRRERGGKERQSELLNAIQTLVPEQWFLLSCTLYAGYPKNGCQTSARGKTMNFNNNWTTKIKIFEPPNVWRGEICDTLKYPKLANSMKINLWSEGTSWYCMFTSENKQQIFKAKIVWTIF